jgi:hypothetical protein
VKKGDKENKLINYVLVVCQGHVAHMGEKFILDFAGHS